MCPNFDEKFWEILKCFSLNIEATKVAQLTGLNPNTVNKYLLLVRKRIAEECEMESPISGYIESKITYEIFYKV